jgi:hypothetical protein
MSNTTPEIPVTNSWISDDSESAKAIDHLIAELLRNRAKLSYRIAMGYVDGFRSSTRRDIDGV